MRYPTQNPSPPRTPPRGSAVHRSPVRSRRARLLRSVEMTLWGFAAIALLTVAGMKADELVYQLTAMPPVESSEFAQGSESDVPVAPGTPIARLEIPRLELDVVVAEGTSSTVLRRAVGRLERSARPGERGNIVLAGHRDTFFRPLAGIREGDLVILDSETGPRTYEVEWVKIVEPTDVHVLRKSRYPALTLVTCYPFQYVGRAPQRFVVRARGHEL